MHETRHHVVERRARCLEEDSLLRNVCAVCSAMSSLIILPVVGSKPPWPERKIHSPTESPGEYGPTVVGAYSELIKVFMGEPP